MAPSALSYTYCSAEDLQALLSTDGHVGRLDDDSSGAINGDESTYLTKAISWATSRVNFFCLSQYAAQDLATSWLVNNWCVVLAAHWLSCRRGNPPPGSFDKLYDETMEDLKMVHSGAHQIPELAYRSAHWPAWSNVRVDALYALRKVRVERPISEGTSTPYQQHTDWPAQFTVEP